jgi:hypothetical protein
MTTARAHRGRHWRKRRTREHRKQEKWLRSLRKYLGTFYDPDTEFVVSCFYRLRAEAK